MTVHRIRILTLGAGLIVLTACARPTTAAVGTIVPLGADLGPSTRASLYKVSPAARRRFLPPPNRTRGRSATTPRRPGRSTASMPGGAG